MKQIIANALYDDFEDAADEFFFEFMVNGNRSSANKGAYVSVMERCERAVCGAKGIDYEEYMDGSFYDEVWQDAADMAQQVMDILRKRYES